MYFIDGKKLLQEINKKGIPLEKASKKVTYDANKLERNIRYTGTVANETADKITRLLHIPLESYVTDSPLPIEGKAPSWKKRCRLCKYHCRLGPDKRLEHIFCEYILQTGHRRGCPGSDCDKFEPIKGKRKKKLTF